MIRARFSVESIERDPTAKGRAEGRMVVTIRDLYDEADFTPTITNDAEYVVAQVHRLTRGYIEGPYRIRYYDSEGDLAELLHDSAGTFCGFRIGAAL